MTWGSPSYSRGHMSRRSPACDITGARQASKEASGRVSDSGLPVDTPIPGSRVPTGLAPFPEPLNITSIKKWLVYTRVLELLMTADNLPPRVPGLYNLGGPAKLESMEQFYKLNSLCAQEPPAWSRRTQNPTYLCGPETTAVPRPA